MRELDLTVIPKELAFYGQKKKVTGKSVRSRRVW